MSVRLLVRDAAIAALNAPFAPNGIARPQIAMVTKRRYVPDQPRIEEGIGLFLLPETVEAVHNRRSPIVQRDLRIAYQVREISESVDDIDDLSDPALMWATRVLCDDRPTAPLRAVVLDIEELGTVWELVSRDLQYAVTTATFLIHYRTNRINQDSLS